MKDLDCRGLACPQPVIRCREAVAAGAAALSVKVDNLAARENVLRYLGNNGFTCTCEEKDGIFHIRATRSGSTTATAPETGGDDTGARTLVLITTPTLGRGDDTLGQRLMETFLGTLPEMRNLWRVVLLNGGVRLSATPGPALDALKKLAESGVYRDAGIRHRMVISHVPFAIRNLEDCRGEKTPFDIENDIYNEWVRVMNEQIHPELMIAGHFHQTEVVPKDAPRNSRALQCDILIGGKPGSKDEYTSANLTVQDSLCLIAYVNQSGNIVKRDTIDLHIEK